MKHRLIVIRLLLPPDQQAPKAVDPRVAALDDPPPRSLATIRPKLLVLVAPRLDVQRVVPATQEPSRIRVVVAFVAAEVLFPAACMRPGPAYGKALQRELDERLVMRVGPRDDDRQRNASSIRKKGTLGAALASVRRVGADFFPRPAEPSSSHHPGSANPSRSLPTRRTLGAPPSRDGRRLPSSSIPGNTGAAYWAIRTRTGPPSIGSRCEARREFHPEPCGGPRAAAPPTRQTRYFGSSGSTRSQSSSDTRQFGAFDIPPPVSIWGETSNRQRADRLDHTSSFWDRL